MSFARWGAGVQIQLVVPGLYLVDDSTIDWLADYAAAGGHLVLGPRTAYADEEGRARNELAPARLTGVAGVHYDEFSNLLKPVPLRAVARTGFQLPRDAVGTRWVEALTATDAQVLATYQHPHLGLWPAITTRPYGQGQVTCVGTVPGRSIARTLAAWLAPKPIAGWERLPSSVTVTTGTARDGLRVHIVHNWNWEPVRVPVPAAMTDVLTGAAVEADATLRLGAWDVHILVSDEPEPR